MSTESGWPAGHDLVELTEIDSTNAEAARRADDVVRPLWIRADLQTRARGRSGRNWQTLTGNLAATLIYRPKATPQTAALRTFAAANALHLALSEYVPASQLSLKWPNDVLFKGGKVAGILLESESAGPQVSWLAVGFGVNLCTSPDLPERADFVPVALDGVISPADFLPVLATHFDAQEQTFQTHGFGPIRERWLGHAARLGEVINARMRNESVTGVFRTVDEDGNLRLETPNGIRAIAAADVIFD